MNWVETLKATALAALAERATPPPRPSVELPWSWNPQGVWLKRVEQPRERTVRPAGPATRRGA